MKMLEVKGKTVEEAIENGLREMDLTRGQVDVTIFDEGSKGFLGFGVKPARVLLTEKPKRLQQLQEKAEQLLREQEEKKSVPAPVKAPEIRAEKPAVKAERPVEKPAVKAERPVEKPTVKAERPAEKPAAKVERPAVKAEKPVAAEKAVQKPVQAEKAPVQKPSVEPLAAVKAEKPVHTEKEDTALKAENRQKRERREGEKRERRDNRPKQQQRELKADAAEAPAQSDQPKAPREKRERREKPAAESVAARTLPTGEPTALSETAKAYVDEIVTRMGLSAASEAFENADGVFVNLSGEDVGSLIGYRGETLDALQYLVSLHLNKGEDVYHRVLIDAENYRFKREETLVRLAHHLANKAVKSGRKVSLEPMNPYERRILHSALQEDHRVRTHSEGDEPYRRVVITPRKSDRRERRHDGDARKAEAKAEA